MRKDLVSANRWAQMSCEKWNSSRAQRKVFREKYRNLARDYARSSEHLVLVRRYREENPAIDTYPWPYSDPEFASWTSAEEPHSAILDQSDCVIRCATSYVAYKIAEQTGKWPQKKSSEGFEARDWKQFLAEAGYNRYMLGETVLYYVSKGHHLVGIDASWGERGLVVWAERGVPEEKGKMYVSSYVDCQYKFWAEDISKFVWAHIC